MLYSVMLYRCRLIRWALIASQANGKSKSSNLLNSEDVTNTLKCLKKLGVKIKYKKNSCEIFGKGLNSLKKPKNEIYLGNSGTSARLLTGLLAAQKFNTVLTGDNSLSRRPMERISEPLNRMNAKIFTSNGTMPLKIIGNDLTISHPTEKRENVDKVESIIKKNGFNTDG